MPEEQRSNIKWSGWIIEVGAFPVPESERDDWSSRIQKRGLMYVRSGDSIVFRVDREDESEIFDCILRRRKITINHAPADLDVEA